MKSGPWIILFCTILAASIIGFPVYRYWIHFGSMLPNDTAVWGQLGDFLNVWVSMASLIVLAGLTFFLHSLDQKRDNDNKNIEDARSRPYLTIKRIDANKYQVRNIGNGPAMNIFFSLLVRNEWTFRSQMSALKTGDSNDFSLDTVLLENIIGFQYCDVHGKVYSTLCQLHDIETVAEIGLFQEQSDIDFKREKLISRAAIATKSLYGKIKKDGRLKETP